MFLLQRSRVFLRKRPLSITNNTLSFQSFREHARFSSTGIRITKLGEEPDEEVPKKRKSRPKRRVKFVDKVRAKGIGGDGGKGCVSFKNRKNGMPGKPDGGDGGDGGDVIVRACSSKSTLAQDSFVFKAARGVNGTSNQKGGKKGADRIINVPLGTVVSFQTPHSPTSDEVEEKSWNEFFGEAPADSHTLAAVSSSTSTESSSSEEIGEMDELDRMEAEIEKEFGDVMRRMEHVDLLKEGDSVIVAAGGKGGRGSLTNKLINRRQKQRATTGLPGQVVEMEFELKTIADVGFVGFPNAGKSTLLGSISHAKPEVASYPFTTLSPSIGVVRSNQERSKYRHEAEDSIRFADIPGLIEGAHQNKGLGHAFLRHIERTRLLVYIIDVCGEDPVNELLILQKELSLYRPKNRNSLADKPSFVFANKSDGDPETVQKNYQRLVEATDFTVVLGSALTGQGIEDFLKETRLLMEEMKGAQEVVLDTIDLNDPSLEFL